jgi:hypothetical protein
MKKVSQNIDKEIRQTLAAFDGITKASPKPFFYSRIIARRERLVQAAEPSRDVSPVLVRVTVSALFILFFVSLYSVVTVQKKDTISTQATTPTELESFIEDYYPQTPTVYNLDEKINK